MNYVNWTPQKRLDALEGAFAKIKGHVSSEVEEKYKSQIEEVKIEIEKLKQKRKDFHKNKKKSHSSNEQEINKNVRNKINQRRS